jgi:hypothetical protein
VQEKDSITGFSSDCCVYVSGATNMLIDGLNGSFPRRNLIRISEWDSGTEAGCTEILPNNTVVVRDAVGRNIGMEAIVVEHPTQPVRDLNITLDAVGAAGSYYGARVNASSTTVPQNCLITGKLRNFGSGAFQGPATAKLKFRDEFGGAY